MSKTFPGHVRAAEACPYYEPEDLRLLATASQELGAGLHTLAEQKDAGRLIATKALSALQEQALSLIERLQELTGTVPQRSCCIPILDPYAKEPAGD